ncbi:acylphosphatase [Candidatus Bipolaricaulota bacterium]|nr:acylphosphatase [Candidatus Bipolaricaulota bacterium]
MEKRLKARVHGLVQGVFFRYFTQIKAHELGLAGTVTNQPDSTVLVIAEGSQEKIDQLLAWLKQGPELARVDHVDVHWSEPLGDCPSFRILR